MLSYQFPLCQLLKRSAAIGEQIVACLFHDVGVWHTTHRFITDAAASRDLMTRADSLQIAPLESPANRGTAIMQGLFQFANNVGQWSPCNNLVSDRQTHHGTAAEVDFSKALVETIAILFPFAILILAVVEFH